MRQGWLLHFNVTPVTDQAAAGLITSQCNGRRRRARVRWRCGGHRSSAAHRAVRPSHSGQTSERYEVGDAREWMDAAVADETPKAGLGERLGTKPAYRHQRLGGFLHDRMSQPAVPFPPREYRGLGINGQEARLWSGRLSFAKTSSGVQVVDLSVLIQTQSPLDDHRRAYPIPEAGRRRSCERLSRRRATREHL